MDTARKPQDSVEYILPARTLSGTRADVVAQIDEFIQALGGLRLMLLASPDSAASDLPGAVREDWRRSARTLGAFVLMLGIATSAGAQSPAAAPQSSPAAATPAPSAPAQQTVTAEKKAEPFAFADFTWLSGNPRTKDSPLQTAAFTGEFRTDTNFTYSFNKPIDDSLSGSSEIFRSGEFQTMAQEAASSNSEILRRIAALEAQLAELKAQVQSQGAPAASQATPPPVTPPADQHHDITFGVGLDTYYMYSPARPIGRVNLLRAYDITSNNFSLNQASVILESPVDLKTGRRFGGRVDLQYGQATETLQGNLANEPRPWVYRNIFQAYGTYVAPVGSGLSVDFGKWASSLGFEGNYTKDQINYSRALYFNFLPFYHTGARVNYQANDAVALHYWITNGTQQTEAFNNFKDQSFGVVLKPTRNVAWTTQYYLGQEHPDVQPVAEPGAPTLPTQPGLSVTPVDPYFKGKLHIFDTYVSWQATPKTLVAAEADYVISRNPTPAADSRVSGGAVFFRQQITSAGAIGARAEYLDDHGGLFTGASRRIGETTLTYDHRVAEGFLVRSEWRRDVSSTPLFLTNEPGVLDKAQNTFGVGLVWWWGTKRDAW